MQSNMAILKERVSKKHKYYFRIISMCFFNSGCYLLKYYQYSISGGDLISVISIGQLYVRREIYIMQTAGERVCIVTETTDPQPIMVGFLPVRYDELHDSLVPPDIRDTPRYKAYMLSVMTGYFHEHFKLIDDV